MRTIATILFVPLAALIVAACSSGGNGGTATAAASPSPTVAVSATVASTPTAQPPAAGATPTTTSAAGTPSSAQGNGSIGPQAVVDGYQAIIQSMYTTCENITDVSCMNGIVQGAGVSPQALSFWQNNRAFLISFQDFGAVDYGAISSPTANMARPEPVFLNGSFGVKYLGTLVPKDWQSQPSYAGLSGVIIAWSEYATLTKQSSVGTSQTFTVALPIRQCRACADLGNLNLEITFDAGALHGVQVLSKTEPPPTPTATP